MQPNIQVVTVVPQFDPNSSRYRCWFGGCCRITTCVRVIGVLELIGVIIDFISTIVQYTQLPNGPRRTDLIIGIVTFLIGITVIAMLFYGVSKERAAFLIPHMVLQIIALILFGVAIVLFGLAASAVTANVAVHNRSNYDTYGDAVETSMAVCIALLIVLLLVFFLEILFFINVLRCYRYLKDKVIYERMRMVAPPPASFPAVVAQEPMPTAPPGYPSQEYNNGYEYKGGPV